MTNNYNKYKNGRNYRNKEKNNMNSFLKKCRNTIQCLCNKENLIFLINLRQIMLRMRKCITLTMLHM